MSTTRSTSQTRRTPISPVAEGDVVDGKYRVERTLAAGGMGVVVAARHLVLEQPVALKFLIPHVQDEQLVARFLREARAAARIQSNHVVRVFDCGTLPDGVPYMAMELLEGLELGQELRARGPLPVEEAVDLVLAALEGLAAAHAVGIVHRDLKPSNLFLASNGRARTMKVLDFGISKPLAGPDTPIDDELTGTAVMLGSPRYASPEQAQSSRDVDVRTDIWSMGVVLYELLDGKCPFGGGSMGEVLGKVLLYRPPPLSTKRADVPTALDEVLSRCIVRDLDVRFPDVAQLAAALAPFASVQGQLHAERIGAVLGTRAETATARRPSTDSASADAPGGTKVAPAPQRLPFPSDALTDIRPVAGRGESFDLPPPAPRAPPETPPVGSVSDATVGTFARSARTPRSKLGVAAIALALLAGALATFVVMSSKRETPKNEPASGAAAQPSAAPRTPEASIGPTSVSPPAPSATPTPPSSPSAAPASSAAASAVAAPGASSQPPHQGTKPPHSAPKPNPKGGILDRSD